jgi:hypothetical protein
MMQIFFTRIIISPQLNNFYKQNNLSSNKLRYYSNLITLLKNYGREMW